MKKKFKDNKNAKVYVAGHNGLIGSAIVRAIKKKGYNNLVLKSSSELDLTNSTLTEEFFRKEKPDFVFVAAAKVGGIKANIDYPAEFIYDNIAIQNNIIHFSWKYDVSKLLFLGSACIYPTKSEQPIKEEYFLSGPFEPTNQAYAVAKTAGIEMCKSYRKQYGCNFISTIPNNLYGPNDNFDPLNSHLAAALIRKFHEAKIHGDKEVVLWGTGTPRRELLYSDDAAEACILLMEEYDSSEVINIGFGEDKSIKEIAEIVKEIAGYNGKIIFDPTKPDGMMQRVLDISKISCLGWKAKTSLREGLKKSYEWFLDNIAEE